MKQIFTLFVCAVLFTSKSLAQSQNFNTPGIITTLQASCWNFYGIGESINSPISGSQHLYIIPTTSTDNNLQANSNIGQIATPYLNFNNGGTIVFSYRLQSSLSTNARRYITARLSDGITSQPLHTITLDRYSPLTTQTFSAIVVPSNSGVKRLIFDFTGDGDGNTGMYFDELQISGAPYSYNSSNCAAVASSNGTLPIKLISFSGQALHKKAELKWTVDENETGNYFEVQKSISGREFTTIGMLFTTQKAGTENYTFTEPSMMNGSAYYRIKIVNNDNSVSYSKTVYLKQDDTKNSNIVLLQTPVQSSVSFNYTSAAAGSATINIYNSAGAKLHSASVIINKGVNSVTTPLSNSFGSGMYILEVTTATGRVTTKFNK